MNCLPALPVPVGTSACLAPFTIFFILVSGIFVQSLPCVSTGPMGTGPALSVFFLSSCSILL